MSGPCLDHTYRGLDHVIPAIAHVTDIVEDVDDSLCLHLLQHVVNGDESTSPPHTSTAERVSPQ